MDLLVVSDTHGKEERLSDLLLRAHADGLLFLGDGLRDLSVVPDTLFSFAVRGNCEAEVDGMVLDFPVSADYGLVFDGERALYLSHGHREVPKMPAGSYYFTGHTHIPHDYVEGGVRFLNPGSVAIPKNQTPHGAILYEDGEVRRIELSEKD